VSLLLKNLLFTLVLPGTIGVYVPLYLARADALAPGPLRTIGILLLALGAALYAWCVWDFAAYGRGTPAPIDAPKRVVTRGLYRYTRNPMYVGVLTVIVGWAAIFGSPAIAAYGAVVAAAFHTFVRLYEEPHLRSLFGAEYEDYCRRVGRWLPRPHLTRGKS
jgi:protein-S-isoprenylcysteine O-methyltransferase Ste14